MKMSLISIATSAALAVTAVQANAATLIIDTFTSSQLVADVPAPGYSNKSALADGSVLGGYRDLQIQNTKNNGNEENASEFRSGNSFLSFSNIAGARGKGYITYDGNNDTSSVDHTGLGGVNLLIGSNPYFFFDVPAGGFDQSASIQVKAWDITGKTVSYTEPLTAVFDPKLYFTSLTGDTGFDWTKIGALQFFVDSTKTVDSVDGVLNSISVVAPVPLPASALLLLGGVSGLAALRRRKKA